MDLVSFAFDHQVDYDQGKPLYIDALDPDRCLNARQLKLLVQKLASGFKNAGVRKGDRVLVHLFNSVYLHSNTRSDVALICTVSLLGHLSRDCRCRRCLYWFQSCLSPL